MYNTYTIYIYIHARLGDRCKISLKHIGDTGPRIYSASFLAVFAMQIQTSITKKTGEDKATVRATERASKTEPPANFIRPAKRASCVGQSSDPDSHSGSNRFDQASTKFISPGKHYSGVREKRKEETESRFRMQIRTNRGK